MMGFTKSANLPVQSMSYRFRQCCLSHWLHLPVVQCLYLLTNSSMSKMCGCPLQGTVLSVGGNGADLCCGITALLLDELACSDAMERCRVTGGGACCDFISCRVRSGGGSGLGGMNKRYGNMLRQWLRPGPITY